MAKNKNEIPKEEIKILKALTAEIESLKEILTELEIQQIKLRQELQDFKKEIQLRF